MKLRHFALSLALFGATVTVSLNAQTENYVEQLPSDEEIAEGSWSCELERKIFGYKYYFCDCKETSIPFEFGMDMTISDTTWFSAPISELRKGLTAYWFANCQIQLEVYAFCSSKEPTFSLRVSPNQMKDMDVTDINKKLDEMGKLGEVFQQAVTPHMRAYPIGDGEGRVICTPFDQGPNSTCEDPLPMYNGMTFISSSPYDVYKFNPAQMPSNSDVFIQWQQKNNLPCDIDLSLANCEADPFLQTQLADSTKVLVLSKQTIANAKAQAQPIFVHIRHDSTYVGRVRVYTKPIYNAITIDTTLCQGMGLQLADTLLTQSVTGYVDTAWVTSNQINVTTYNLTITPPETIYDTITLSASQLPTLYRKEKLIDHFGDYDFVIHTPGQCDERILLHVVHGMTTLQQYVDTTICTGKTFTMGGKTYPNDTTFKVTTMPDADTQLITTYNVQYTLLETEYMNLSLYASQLPYYETSLRHVVENFGTQTIKVEGRNTCTRTVELTVTQLIDITQTTIDTTLCAGKTFTTPKGLMTDHSAVLVDTVIVSQDAKQINQYNVTILKPEVLTESVQLPASQLPYTHVATGEVITDFGTHIITAKDPNGCTYKVTLTLTQLDEPTRLQDNQVDNNLPYYLQRDENGNLYIIRDNQKYTLTGQHCK